MDTRFYHSPELDLQRIAQAIVLEYQAKGFEARQFGSADVANVQLKKESLLRSITGFDKALGIVLQRADQGTFVQVGAQDWTDQIAVGAVGLVLHPLLVTAAVGALTQNSVVHDIIRFIDYQVRQQQPGVAVSIPPTSATIF
jgi:hypothetical protein